MREKYRSTIALSEADVLDAPLPLIQLSPEVRRAKTGWAERLSHLPVHRPKTGSKIDSAKVLKKTFQSTGGPKELFNTNRNNDDEDSRMVVYTYPKNGEKPLKFAEHLQFDSVFESGNLLRADFVTRSNGTQDYELVLQQDLNNSAYSQWFYFKVKNADCNVPYTFSIINLAKAKSLFDEGQQPVVYSKIRSQTQNLGWMHEGSNVGYHSTTSTAEGADKSTLTFTYTFEHEDDEVYFASLPPYTYTDLIEYLRKVENDPARRSTFKRTELCQTIANNACDLLTITGPNSEGIPKDDRKCIVISSRVHPGESNSSWMMKGILDFLTGSSANAIVLKQNFIFKIVPMLNPDGVINGNTRVNLSGWDLNRKWAFPVQKLFPTIYYLKALIGNLNASNGVAMFCDLHGHSIHKNIFMYGCYKRVRKSKASKDTDPRIFPMIVSKKSDLFAFSSCCFKVQKSKMNTARVVVHELGVTNSYTLEASFCGPDFGPKRNTQFSVHDLEDMGHQWCESLVTYYKLQRQRDKVENPLVETARMSSLSIQKSSDLVEECEFEINRLFDDELDGEADEAQDSEGSEGDEAGPPIGAVEQRTPRLSIDKSPRMESKSSAVPLLFRKLLKKQSSDDPLKKKKRALLKSGKQKIKPSSDAIAPTASKSTTKTRRKTTK